MGNSFLWFQPTLTSRTIDIDLGTKVTQRHGPRPVYRSSLVEGLTGEIAGVGFGGRSQIRIELTWSSLSIAGRLLRRHLFNLINHLQRQGTCAFAEDASYAWATFLTILPTIRSTSLSLKTPQLFEALVPSVSTTGREICLQSDPDAFLVEERLVSAHTAGAVTLALNGSVTFPFREQATWALVRELGSYPALRLPISAINDEHLTNDGERSYHLDLPLEEDPVALEALQSVALSSTTTDNPNPPAPSGTNPFSTPAVKGWRLGP